jgi:hypothetical protein
MQSGFVASCPRPLSSLRRARARAVVLASDDRRYGRCAVPGPRRRGTRGTHSRGDRYFARTLNLSAGGLFSSPPGGQGHPPPLFLGKYLILFDLAKSITYGKRFRMSGLWLKISARSTSLRADAREGRAPIGARQFHSPPRDEGGRVGEGGEGVRIGTMSDDLNRGHC